MESLTNPHDRFFKESFSRLETARDFVRHYLPADVTALLNLDTLEITKDSFINEKLKRAVLRSGVPGGSETRRVRLCVSTV